MAGLMSHRYAPNGSRWPAPLTEKGPEIMPALTGDVIGVALDMYGCPNQCRHCYLGSASGGYMTEDDLRWAVEQFRCFMGDGQEGSAWEKLQVSTWLREPNFANDYKRLYELECELSDVSSARPSYEVLSVWRAAHDPEYPHWAYDIGMRVCQISVFGLEESGDWDLGVKARSGTRRQQQSGCWRRVSDRAGSGSSQSDSSRICRDSSSSRRRWG